MQKLICIGELLIDFIPLQKGLPLQDVTSFKKVAGGAPANVAACVAKLGGKSTLITQVGKDAFGDYLIHEMHNIGLDTHYIQQTTEAPTALAFVSLKQDGERDFSFYRSPSADMLLDSADIKEELFQSNDILHFCSVDLVDYPVKKAHLTAIKYAHKHDCIVSFDPNLRFPLWPNKKEYRDTIIEFIPLAHILKVSQDELPFITQTKSIDEAVQKLFVGNVIVVIITNGSQGATMYTRNHSISVPTLTVKATDSTGAGDSFIGAILYQILTNEWTLDTLDHVIDKDVLDFAHTVSRIVVQQKGAIPAMPDLKTVLQELT